VLRCSPTFSGPFYGVPVWPNILNRPKSVSDDDVAGWKCADGSHDGVMLRPVKDNGENVETQLNQTRHDVKKIELMIHRMTHDFTLLRAQVIIQYWNRLATTMTTRLSSLTQLKTKYCLRVAAVYHAHRKKNQNPCNLGLSPMTLKFSRVLEVVEVDVRAKF